MKKQIVVALCMLLSAGFVVFSSCKKDSDNNSIVGSWELAKVHQVITVVNPPQTIDTTYTYTHGHSIVVNFNANGNYVNVDYTAGAPDTISTGTYAYHGSQIISKENGTSVSDTINVSISGSTLTATQLDANSSFSSTITSTFNRQ